MMNSFEILVAIMAIITILGGLGVALFSNVLYAALSLLSSFLGMAGLFFCLQLSFVAVTQIMIYIGGVLVLMIFGIMFTSRVKSSKEIESPNRLGKGGIMTFGALVVGCLGYILSFLTTSNFVMNVDEYPVEDLGVAFMTDYILSFEFIAIALLVVLIGAVFIAGNKVKT